MASLSFADQQAIPYHPVPASTESQSLVPGCDRCKDGGKVGANHLGGNSRCCRRQESGKNRAYPLLCKYLGTTREACMPQAVGACMHTGVQYSTVQYCTSCCRRLEGDMFCRVSAGHVLASSSYSVQYIQAAHQIWPGAYWVSCHHCLVSA